MQADAPVVSSNEVEGHLPTLGVIGDLAPSRPSVPAAIDDDSTYVVTPAAPEPLTEPSSGASPLMPPVVCSAPEVLGQEEALRLLQSRPLGQPSPIPEARSPSLSVSAEGSVCNGTGSFAGQPSLGSAVIVEDVDSLEPQQSEFQCDGDELASLRVPEIQQETSTSMLEKGLQSSNSMDEHEAPTSSARLAWTKAELHACRDELNSAVYEARSLRHSEEVTAEAASSVTLMASTELSLEPGDLRAELEVARLRILGLEGRNAELTSDNEDKTTRMDTFEKRVRELEEELKARPFAPDSDFEVRMAEKNRQIERLRLHANEATKELELRQETIDAMEARLRQAERASQFPAVGTTVHVPAKVVERPEYAARLANNQARIDAAQMELQRLSQAAGSQFSSRQTVANGVSSLEDARARVKSLYEQMASRHVEADTFTNGDVSRGRALRSTLTAVGSREPSLTNRLPVVRSISPSQRSQDLGTFDAPKNGVKGSRLLVNTWGEGKRLDAQVSGVSSLTNSTKQVPTPLLTPGSSSQSLALGLSPDGRPHMEVQRLRHNVSELETLMTQMVGEKARTTNSLEQKIVELEMAAGQAKRSLPTSSASLSEGVYRLVGSHGSSTRTSSPLPAARTIEVTRSASPVPSPSARNVQPARTLSPTPNTGGLYYLSPQSSPQGSTSLQQLSSSPAPRRSISRTPSQSRVFPQSSVVANYPPQQGASSSPPQQAALGAVAVSRSPSPAVARGQIARDMPTPMNMAAWLGRAG